MQRTLFILLFFVTFAQAQDRNVTLVLPWKHQFQFAGYYIAKEMGFYKKAGLNVHIKEYDLKRDNTKAVSIQEVDFGIGHSSLILDKLNQYPNIVLLTAVHQSSPLVLLSRKRADITSLKDIADKKIMMSRDQTYTASINAMLSSENLKANSYKVIDTSFNPIDLINGNADLMMSYSSNEPYAMKEKGIEYTIFDPKDYDFNLYSDILFTSSQMIKNNPDMVEAFYQASMKGWEYAYSHIDESIEIISQHYNTQSRSKKALLFEANTLKKLAYQEKISFGNISDTKVKEIIDIYHILGLITKDHKIDYSTFIYKSSKDLKFKDIKEANDLNFIFLYSIYFKILLIALLLTIFIGLYFKLKMDKVLALKTAQLNKQNKIFNENISSSKADINGKITYVSDAFCYISGYKRKEIIGKTHSISRDKETPAAMYKDLWMTITSGHTWRGELKNRKKDGSVYWVDTVISPIFDSKNNIVEYDSIITDVTLKKVLEEFNKKLELEVKERTIELENLAITDKLTNIYNRLRLDQELSYNYKNYLRYDKIYSIILIDIDLFKKVNDTYGHQVGDEVLQKVSFIMKELIRSTDILGRWGGEEFMIISPNTDIDGAYTLTQNIRSNIEKTMFDSVEKVTISAGISQIDSNLDEKSIITKADEALYRAKNKGRNRVEK
jgi:diguanylate cyclase (GGDEF)-like protein/PAS domain S-box-containing protein